VEVAGDNVKNPLASVRVPIAPVPEITTFEMPFDGLARLTTCPVAFGGGVAAGVSLGATGSTWPQLAVRMTVTNIFSGKSLNRAPGITTVGQQSSVAAAVANLLVL
jgi:hypothetical protein